MLQGLSKLIPATRASSESSATPFAARLRIAARVVQPRVNVVPKSSPASSRTPELPFPSQIRSSRPANDAGLEHKCANPEFHSGLFSTVPQKTRHFSEMARPIWTFLSMLRL